MTFTISLDEKRDYDWVCKVILSCRTIEQNDNAYNLVNFFYRKHHSLMLSSALIGLSTEVEQKIRLYEVETSN
jgi:hypothetical protein